jgi:hypothetical protein
VIHADAASDYFEVELGNGRRVRVPFAFDAAALECLLGVVDPAR